MAIYNGWSGQLFAADPKVSPYDISQGPEGICYALTAIGELAMLVPSFIEATIRANPNGTYSDTLYRSAPSGSWLQPQTMTIDPASIDLSYSQGYSKNGDRVLWPNLIVTAYALLNGGKDAISNGGWPAYVMQELTGGSVQVRAIQNFTLSNLQAVSGKNLITFDTWDQPDLPFGIVRDHSYMFGGLVTVNGQSFVKLANPWGAFSGAEPPLIAFSDLGKAFQQVDIGALPATSGPVLPYAPVPHGTNLPSGKSVENFLYPSNEISTLSVTFSKWDGNGAVTGKTYNLVTGGSEVISDIYENFGAGKVFTGPNGTGAVTGNAYDMNPGQSYYFLAYQAASYNLASGTSMNVLSSYGSRFSIIGYGSAITANGSANSADIEGVQNSFFTKGSARVTVDGASNSVTAGFGSTISLSNTNAYSGGNVVDAVGSTIAINAATVDIKGAFNAVTLTAAAASANIVTVDAVSTKVSTSGSGDIITVNNSSAAVAIGPNSTSETVLINSSAPFASIDEQGRNNTLTVLGTFGTIKTGSNTSFDTVNVQGSLGTIEENGNQNTFSLKGSVFTVSTSAGTWGDRFTIDGGSNGTLTELGQRNAWTLGGADFYAIKFGTTALSDTVSATGRFITFSNSGQNITATVAGDYAKATMDSASSQSQLSLSSNNADISLAGQNNRVNYTGSASSFTINGTGNSLSVSGSNNRLTVSGNSSVAFNNPGNIVSSSPGSSTVFQGPSASLDMMSFTGFGAGDRIVVSNYTYDPSVIALTYAPVSGTDNKSGVLSVFADRAIIDKIKIQSSDVTGFQAGADTSGRLQISALKNNAVTQAGGTITAAQWTQAATDIAQPLALSTVSPFAGYADPIKSSGAISSLYDTSSSASAMTPVLKTLGLS